MKTTKQPKQPKHRIRMPESKLHIPAMSAPIRVDDTVAYVGQFDRLNGLKPLPFIFRGKVIMA